jgi:hypothetical protein
MIHAISLQGDDVCCFVKWLFVEWKGRGRMRMNNEEEI